jgi:hypothetical protein
MISRAQEAGEEKEKKKICKVLKEFVKGGFGAWICERRGLGLGFVK